MAEREALTAAYVRSILDYNPETGAFHWKERADACVQWNARRPGSIAGTISVYGYVSIGINGEYYRAHRLAWLWMTGEWPVNQIDHINGMRYDNRFCNLRPATRHENGQNINRHGHGNCGMRGVHYNKRQNKYTASIRLNGVKKHLGTFLDPISAHQAYCCAKSSMHLFQPTLRDW